LVSIIMMVTAATISSTSVIPRCRDRVGPRGDGSKIEAGDVRRPDDVRDQRDHQFFFLLVFGRPAE
jgi:hypothetical protein